MHCIKWNAASLQNFQICQCRQHFSSDKNFNHRFLYFKTIFLRCQLRSLRQMKIFSVSIWSTINKWCTSVQSKWKNDACDDDRIIKFLRLLLKSGENLIFVRSRDGSSLPTRKCLKQHWFLLIIAHTERYIPHKQCNYW